MASMAEAADAGISTRTLSEADFAAPLTDRYFEDYLTGAVYEYGYASVTEPEIIEFARRFDPQPMHVDPEWAATGPFGGIIASGFHTAGLFMRLYVDHYISRVASLASPGLDEIRWPIPVRPGDKLWIRTTVLETRRSKSKPDRGLVHTRGEMFTDDDRQVLSLTALNFLQARNAGA
jgi:acyl dehydratase